MSPTPCETSCHTVVSIVKKEKAVSSKTDGGIHAILARGNECMGEHATRVVLLSRSCTAPELLHCTLIVDAVHLRGER
jgi:hypothetical protein